MKRPKLRKCLPLFHDVLIFPTGFGLQHLQFPLQGQETPGVEKSEPPSPKSIVADSAIGIGQTKSGHPVVLVLRFR